MCREKGALGAVVSQGFGAPSPAVLGPKGVVVLVVAGPFRSQGFGGAGRPVHKGLCVSLCNISMLLTLACLSLSDRNGEWPPSLQVYLSVSPACLLEGASHISGMNCRDKFGERGIEAHLTCAVSPWTQAVIWLGSTRLLLAPDA